LKYEAGFTYFRVCGWAFADVLAAGFVGPVLSAGGLVRVSYLPWSQGGALTQFLKRKG
jgi:hypothetical protein